jgi:hypothetical protein
VGKRDFQERTGGRNDWLGLSVKFTDLALGQRSRQSSEGPLTGPLTARSDVSGTSLGEKMSGPVERAER